MKSPTRVAGLVIMEGFMTFPDREILALAMNRACCPTLN